MSKPGFYAIIPASVRYDENLTGDTKLLYGEITALCGAEGYCWAGNDYFANLYNVSKETISRRISALKRNGYIKTVVDKKTGNNRRIYLLTESSNPIDGIVKPLLTESSNPIDGIVKQNIIYNTKKEIYTTAFDFLKKKYPQRLEAVVIKFKSTIQDWDEFVDFYNNRVEELELPYTDRALFGRLVNTANTWVRNQGKNKSNPIEEQTISQKVGKRLA